VCGKKEEACLTKAVIVDVDGWQKEESRQPTFGGSRYLEKKAPTGAKVSTIYMASRVMFVVSTASIVSRPRSPHEEVPSCGGRAQDVQ
jgi:hypothetical protein